MENGMSKELTGIYTVGIYHIKLDNLAFLRVSWAEANNFKETGNRVLRVLFHFGNQADFVPCVEGEEAVKFLVEHGFEVPSRDDERYHRYW
jgi:hypothetical protein